MFIQMANKKFNLYKQCECILNKMNCFWKVNNKFLRFYDLENQDCIHVLLLSQSLCPNIRCLRMKIQRMSICFWAQHYYTTCSHLKKHRKTETFVPLHFRLLVMLTPAVIFSSKVLFTLLHGIWHCDLNIICRNKHKSNLQMHVGFLE